MTNDYTLWIVSPPDLVWSHVFDEVALSLQSAFVELGYQASVVTDPRRIEGVPIVLGANLCPMYKIALPDNAIIYNLEQVHPDSRWFKPGYRYVELMQRHPVWDFSQRNIEALKKFGVENVVHCAVGYAGELSRIRRSKEDTDVVFIGGHDPRRRTILEGVRRGGAQLQHVYKVFGKERDDWIARGKIHLNIHKEPAALFEIVRVSYLLANRSFVISEESADIETMQQFKDAVVFCPYDQLVDTGLRYLVNPKERRRIAGQGFEVIRSMPQKTFLEAALEQHLKLHPPRRIPAAKERDSLQLFSMPRIFVSVASYRDPEILPTLQDMFAKASYPSRVNVGVCLQVDPALDKDCLIPDDFRPQQVRISEFHPGLSRGANWARAQAFALIQGEEYALMIDSHMRFTHGWDEAFIDMLARAPSDKPVISAYSPDYRPPGTLVHHRGHVLRMRLKPPLKRGDDPRLVHISGVLVPESDPRVSTLYPTPFCIVNCMFARASVFAEVPVDPHIHFWGDEVDLSARLWTRGYDIFQPDRVLCYHYWVRKDKHHLHDYREYESEQNKRSLSRIRHRLGLDKTADPLALEDNERFAPGNVRRLDDLWAFAGIDLVARTITPQAQQGIWHLDRRKQARQGEGTDSPEVISLRQPSVDGLQPRIFVGIASYRDPDCQRTVKDLFKKARHPHRINVGICWQFIKDEDRRCFEIPYPYPDQVRVMEVDARESRGVCWARGQVQRLWQGEEFALQIDSHMRFEYGWDEAFLAMWKECGSEKAVLTCYPPGFTPPNRLDRRFIFGMAAKEFDSNGMFLMLGYPAYRVGREEPAHPMPGAFLSANTVFGPAGMIRDVPYDPHIYFFGEEISLAVRLWTHGYDLFHPNRMVIFHDWVRTGRPTHFTDFEDWQTANLRSHKRVKHMLGIEPTDDAGALQELEHYGLGRVRTLAQYEDYAGVNFAQKAISGPALKGEFDPAKAQPEKRKDVIVTLPHTPRQVKSVPMIKHSAGKQPGIFINIASYRDPECQWTVKDLYEKAKHPDRINVGICWQFDEQEDKHCFEVSTRPQQVRIMPVDWREAEGVCWARHETQKLWDGEDYTLMTDSHMRFVPGWDELMIRELDACESNKPLLSCSPTSYTPPDKLGRNMNPTVRRVKPFQPDGNIRCHGEMLDRTPPRPLNGAFVVANFIFSRSDITPEVPYDPFLYFDQEEITYAARLYTHGWDAFSARRQFLYHFYNDHKAPAGSVRPLHWRDLRKENEERIRYLRERGLKRFNHMTRFRASNEPDVIRDLHKYGFGNVRTLDDYEAYSGVDFRRKIATERALRCEFIKDLHLYRDRPIFIPEIDGSKPPEARAPQPVNPRIAKEQVFYSNDSNYPPVRSVLAAPAVDPSQGRSVPVMARPAGVAAGSGAAAMGAAAAAAAIPVTPPNAQRAAVPQPLPKMLEVGDFFPMIELDDTNKKARAVEIFAGRFCLVVYLPANQPEFLKRYFAELGNRIPAAGVQEAWLMHVLDDTPDQLIELRNRLNIGPTLHADPGRAVARALGIARVGEHFTPVGFILGPSLKIVHRHIHDDPLQLAAGLVHYCAIEMERLRNKYAGRKVITELAPALIVPNVLSPELCAKCIDAFRTGKTFDGTVGALEGKAYRADIKVRTDYVVYGDLMAELDEKMSRSLFPEIKKIYGFDVTHRELYKIGMYSGEKKGFFRAHRDNYDAPLGYRRIACTVHLNDEYEGGGLRFPEYDDHVYRPPAGSAIAFSCSTLHEARPVTAGERFVVVAFFHGREDEAFRHYFAREKNLPLNNKDFTPTLRTYPQLRMSRGFFDRWQADNVSYALPAAAQMPLQNPAAHSGAHPADPAAPLGVMVNTTAGHRAKKVMENEQVIVLDDFLPEDVYRQVYAHATITDYERINTAGKSVRAWHVHDGFPLRTCDNMFYNAPGHANHRENAYPGHTPNDRFVEHMAGVAPHAQHLIGKPSEEWAHFSVTGWMYPPGTGLSMHDDGSGVYTGAYVYFMSPTWRPHWGGLLVVMNGEANRKIFDYRRQIDEIDYYKRKWLHANPLDDMLMDHGLSQCIFPKRNRVVFMASNAYHMVTRVNEQCGDNLRMSLAGFFNRKR